MSQPAGRKALPFTLIRQDHFSNPTFLLAPFHELRQHIFSKEIIISLILTFYFWRHCISWAKILETQTLKNVAGPQLSLSFIHCFQFRRMFLNKM